MKYANNLKAWRDERGWSREALAELLDVSPVTVFRIERGDQQPRGPLLLKICALFNESPNDFYASEANVPRKVKFEGPPRYNFIGRNLHRIREERNLSLEQLSYKTGILKQTIYNLEQTGEPYSDKIVDSLCGALDITPGALFDERAARDYYPSGRPFLIKDARDFSVAGPPDESRRYTFDDGSFGANTFAWKAPDKSMAPERQPQDILLIDPDVTPSPNAIVLAQQENESPIIRRYRLVSSGPKPVFELVPADDGYPTLRSDREIIKIHGVEVQLKKR